jgi:hypothetical protein
MSKKNFTILGMSYEEYQDMKYKMLARALEEQEDYDAYCKQMEKENSDYFRQQDQNELPW